jgi:hypothetical protein
MSAGTATSPVARMHPNRGSGPSISYRLVESGG